MMTAEEWARLRETSEARTQRYRQFKDAQTSAEYWGIIRAMYAVMMPAILEASQRNLRGRCDPYFLPWQFSPIEEMAWHSIRFHGLPFYPQVPVAGVFLDFANPYTRIGLELDGKDFHDSEKDKARDWRLMQVGWKIFRIAGSECHAKYLLPIEMEEQGLAEDETEDAMRQWLLHTSDGVIASLDWLYYRRQPWRWHALARQSLDAHRLVPFAL